MSDRRIQKLINRAKGHDPDAFTELMQLHMKDMYRTAIAILMNDADTADAIQDTILSCWEKMNTLRENRYFKTWLTRILINKCYDIRKQQEKRVSFEECGELTVSDSYPAEFHEVLSALDDRYRIPMMLFYGQGYRTGEIAKLLQIPQSTVQTRLMRGGVSVTDGTITVTPETVIADDIFAYISFSVSGYSIGDNEEPCFEFVDTYLGNDPMSEDSWVNMSASFYDGLVSDENGVPHFCGVVLKDGTRLPYLWNGGGTGYSDTAMSTAYALGPFPE